MHRKGLCRGHDLIDRVLLLRIGGQWRRSGLPGCFRSELTVFHQRMVFKRPHHSRAETLGFELGQGQGARLELGDQRRLFGCAMRGAIRQALTPSGQSDPRLGQRALGLAATLARGKAQRQYLAERMLIVISGPGKQCSLGVGIERLLVQ